MFFVIFVLVPSLSIGTNALLEPYLPTLPLSSCFKAVAVASC